MRIAVLADIHGNLPAFEAALKSISQQKVDQIVLAGDIVIGSPDSKACWELAQSLGCIILRGNHERYVAHYGTSDASPLWSLEQFGPLHWAVEQLSEQDRYCMDKLPLQFRSSETPDLFFVHSTERDDHDMLTSFTPEQDLNKMFPTAQERYIVRAHSHCGQMRIWEKGIIVTSGSVGLPLDAHPSSQYLLIDQDKQEWNFQHCSVPYDIEATISRFHETGYLSSVGPMAHLFLREVITGSHNIYPFLRLYSQWSKKGEISLSQAVDRFLSL